MRYYFDVETPQGRALDREGTEYFSRHDMQSSAVKLLLEIARAESDRENCEVAIHVRDAAGLMVSTLKLNMNMTWSSIH
jgi:hypothetical protein